MSAKTELHNLLEMCQSDSAVHFRAVYDLLVERIYGYIKARVNSNDEALDLTQEVFIDIYQALPNFKYQSDEAFYSFIYTICKRKLAKHYQKTKLAPATSEELDEYAGPPLKTDDPDLFAALSQLGEMDQEIISLHHWSRYTFGEIAEALNMTESAIRVRHHRSLKTLAEILSK